MPNDTHHATGKVSYILLSAIGVLSLVGLWLAAELTGIHYNTHQNPEFHSMCAISEGLNCETVALSPYSVFLNLPVSIWGIMGYLLIFVFAAVSLKLNDRGRPLIGAISGFSTIAFLSSLLLATISFAKIDSMCLFCMGTYAVNSILLILSIIMLVKGPKNPFTAVRDDLIFLTRKPLLLGFIVIMGIGPMAIAYARITPYWHTAGFDDMPSFSTGIDEDGNHWIGAATPSVTIIEYTDYECPYCRKAHKQLRELLSKYAGKVRVVHRHFPLDQACNPKIKQKFHQFACHFSTAVECAARGDKFWEMNDAIFSSQETQKAETIDVEKFAIQLGLDRSEFNQCLKDESIQKIILKNINQGIADYVSATPTFVVNGQAFKGRLTEEQLVKLLNAAE
ncbi:MAG: thioredoxin domain-containing protein [Deltaproteobacteria bacterium]|nr:thioredoxin domain-containing protein [Deltaproteobacteria bacterium]